MFILRKSAGGRLLSRCVVGMVLLFLLTTPVFAAKVNLRLAYPVELGGPLAKIMDSLCEEFSSQNPEIHVTPIYAGNYWETM
ncbi:unnamed protein product, partial [marine sediment metagenome]